MKKTKIICTIGPASDKPEILSDLARAGMDVVRLNLSHGSHESYKKNHFARAPSCTRAGPSYRHNGGFTSPKIRVGEFKEPSCAKNAVRT